MWCEKLTMAICSRIPVQSAISLASGLTQTDILTNVQPTQKFCCPQVFQKKLSWQQLNEILLKRYANLQGSTLSNSDIFETNTKCHPSKKASSPKESIGSKSIIIFSYLRQLAREPSSEWSWQSATRSHTKLEPMHSPFLHLNWSRLHWPGMAVMKWNEIKELRGRGDLNFTFSDFNCRQGKRYNYQYSLFATTVCD